MSLDARQSLLAWGAGLLIFGALALTAGLHPLIPQEVSDTLLSLLVASLLWQAVRMSRGRKVAKPD